jgi:hypothetical protein
MPIKILFIPITLLSIFTLKADDTIGTESDKSLDKEKTLAMLCVITNFMLSEKKEVVDQPTVFNLSVATSGPVDKTLGGFASDLDGAEKVDTFYDNRAVAEGTYTDDDNDGKININNERFHFSGTPYRVEFTDDLGNKKSESGTL